MGKWMDKIKSTNTVLDSVCKTSIPSLEDQDTDCKISKGTNYPTPSGFRVPDGIKVSGSLPDTLTEKSKIIASGTPDIDMGKVSGYSPTPSDTFASARIPKTRTYGPVDYCAQFVNDPPTREQAIARLAATFAAEVRASDPDDPETARALRQRRADRQLERWTATTLSGKPVSGASPTYLTLEAIALYCWARDRAEHGVRNRGAWVWLEAARAAMKATQITPTSRAA